ncbi:hypothetical protein WL95_27395 [Burkholderia cepacia]|nr:hypothetical protein WL95_27395 [Burkholderia cepacia]
MRVVIGRLRQASSAFAFITYSFRDQFGSNFPQQCFRQRAGATIGKSTQFDQVTRKSRHGSLLRISKAA